MTPEEISDLAFLLYPDIVKSKPDAVSVESLAQRIRGMQDGLQPEDEFAATVAWLGNCAAIHRIDQTPMPVPAPGERMRAPDFIAFPLVGGKPFPVLVEVKSHHGPYLDWSESYLNSLRAFADCARLPLLIAWKCGALWFLVDNSQFKKNVTAYRLEFKTALIEDLYCLLFRNLRIQMHPELELILDMEILDEMPGDKDTLLPAGSIHLKITRAGYYRGGKEITDYDGRLTWLVMSAPDDVELRRTGKQACQQIFRPLPDQSFTLSNVLATHLSMGASDETIDWHQVLRKGEFGATGKEFSDLLEGAIRKGFVRYVMDIVPGTWPAFLPHDKAIK